MLTYAHRLHQATTSRNGGKSKERIDLNNHERLTKAFKIMVKNKSENNSWIPWFGQLHPVLSQLKPMSAQETGSGPDVITTLSSHLYPMPFPTLHPFMWTRIYPRQCPVLRYRTNHSKNLNTRLITSLLSYTLV